MSKLSNIDKARLATELCGLERGECKAGDLYLQGKDGPFVCDVDDFDPVDNAEQAMLVLAGLVKKQADMYSESNNDAWRTVLKRLSYQARQLIGPFNFPSAVCTAGLEVLGKDKP